MGMVDGQLKCDMKKDCSEQITHIDEKGFIYCREHGRQRKNYGRYAMKCRQLRPFELNQLKAGKPLRRY